jgi:Fic-DOC domain mobile mystery protein B
VRRLHKRMFGDTWRWAGTFRSTEKNIGIDPARIQPALLDLFQDAVTQLEHKSLSLDEIAARFSHRLVSIHPFANGNGRLSRTMADLLLLQQGAERFSWRAGKNPAADGDTRQAYLDALRAADARLYKPLLAFVRS